MTLQEMMDNPNSPETDAVMRRILTSLYEIAARDKGYELEYVHIYRRGEPRPETERSSNCIRPNKTD